MLNIIIFKLIFVLIYNTFSNIDTQEISKSIKKQSPNISTNINYTKGFLENIEENYKDLLATITIDKINLHNKPIYNKSSNKNNIEKNITILKESTMPDNNKSIIFLIAHSGFGEIAYFKNLHKLQVNDEIILNYNNKRYLYKVANIYKVAKTGYLQIKKSYKKELILSTCSKNENKQLIIDCELIN